MFRRGVVMVVYRWRGRVMGCVSEEWGHGLCLGRVGPWFVSRSGGAMVCV